MKKSNALVVGATGLVGSHLVDQILRDEHYENLYVISRRPLEINHPKLRVFIRNFDELDETFPEIDIDHVYCALGTTKKKAPNKDFYRKVDYHYPIKIAQQSLKKGASSLCVVSSIGADAASSFFYNQLKGEMEQEIGKLSFKNLYIFRPSLLVGEREEHRLAEGLSIKASNFFAPLMKGPLKKYSPTSAKGLASVMIKKCLTTENLHLHIIENTGILKIMEDISASRI